MLFQAVCSNVYCRETQNGDYSGTTLKGPHAVTFLGSDSFLQNLQANIFLDR